MANTEGAAPRRAALAVLEAVRQGAPFDRALDRLPDTLSERDRRFAHEVAAGVLRHQADLDRALAPLARQGWTSVPAPLKDILRIGAYQLRHLDRVPPHAAVSTSVALARETTGKGPAGFVNAVLRRVPRDTPTAATASDPGALAADHSHPEWLVARWLERFGPESTRRLLAWNDTRPPLVVQPARRPAEDLVQRFREAGMMFEVRDDGAGIVVKGGRPATFPGYEEGAFIIQDPAQVWVTRYCDVPPGATVYDACAAPGGKAVALSRTAGLVVAGEWRTARLARLLANLERAAVGSWAVIAADGAAPPLNDADMVLVDAPCTATGTLARHPDARHRLRPDDVGRMAERQQRILVGAASAVRPGGLLVYATCSLEPEENEAQVDRFLSTHPDFERSPTAGLPPALLTAAGDLQIVPQRDAMDGAYAARLQRDDR